MFAATDMTTADPAPAVLGKKSYSVLDRIARIREFRHLATDTDFAAGRQARAKDGLEQFGPSGADQSRQHKDFVAAQSERDVLEFPGPA